MQRNAVLAFAFAFAAGSCRSPTQITFEVTTDVACSEISSTSITTGTLGGLEAREPAAVTSRCDEATGRIGSLVVVPSGNDDAEVAVRVVTGGATTPEACVAAGYTGDCIVARRSLRFVPHTPLRLPIEMSAACRGVVCDTDETCSEGECVSATIESPEECAGPRGCTLPPPDAGTKDALPDLSQPDAGDGEPPLDAPSEARDANTEPPPDAERDQDAGMPDLGAGDAPKDAAPDQKDAGADAAADADADAGFMVPIHAWNRAFGGGSTADIAWSVAVDGAGNAYVAGSFEGSANFGGGARASSASSEDLFVASYTRAGMYRWDRTFGGSGIDAAYAVAFGGGRVFASGIFEGSVTFSGTPSASNGAADVFVVALDPATGASQWAQTFGSSGFELAQGIAADGSGNVFATGGLAGPAMVGSFPLTGAGIYAVSYGPSGAPRWANRYGSGGSLGRSAAVDTATADVVIVGDLASAVSFGGPALSYAGGLDVFVATLTSAGAYRSARSYGTAGQEAALGVAVGPSGNVVITGDSNTPLSFGGPAVSGGGMEDFFAASFTSTGTHGWSRGAGGATMDRGFAVATDPAGRAYVGGFFSGTTNFGTGNVTPMFFDGFLAIYASDGTPLFSRALGGSGTDQVLGVAVDPGTGGVLAVGAYEGAPDFGGGALPNAAGGMDGFIVRYDP